MFKKIHSNRDPRDTLYSELKKEFSVYFDKGNHAFKNLAGAYPKSIFSLMIILLLASLIVAVVLHDKVVSEHKPAAAASREKVTPLNDGFDNIMAAAAALKETIRLRREVDSITAKRTLTKPDSLTLLRDLDSLRQIRITLPN